MRRQPLIRTPLPRNGRWKRWGLAAAGWSALALLFATQNYVTIRTQGEYVTWLTLLHREIPVWAAWGMLSPLVFALARRFPIGGREGYTNLWIHIPAGIVTAFVQIAVVLALAYLIGVEPRTGSSMFTMVKSTFSSAFAITICIYAFIVMTYHAVDYYRAYRGRELAASQLEASLAQARLDLLRMQIHPHFLFNTLHGISALMAKDVPAARRMIARLSDLLRLSLEHDGAQETTLGGELELLGKYVEIQLMRFADRLTVELAIDDDTRGMPVPKLLLQPIVENAIRHGIARHAGPGRIEVSARREGERLRLEVRDNGPGLGGEPLREGVGLGNTRERLARLYGREQSFTIENAPEGGAVVTIIIPRTSHGENDA